MTSFGSALSTACLLFTSAVAFKANDLWSHDYGDKFMCQWPCVSLWVYCQIIVSHSQTYYCWIISGLCCNLFKSPTYILLQPYHAHLHFLNPYCINTCVTVDCCCFFFSASYFHKCGVGTFQSFFFHVFKKSFLCSPRLYLIKNTENCNIVKYSYD